MLEDMQALVGVPLSHRPAAFSLVVCVGFYPGSDFPTASLTTKESFFAVSGAHPARPHMKQDVCATQAHVDPIAASLLGGKS